jgi:hypothetical protein
MRCTLPMPMGSVDRQFRRSIHSNGISDLMDAVRLHLSQKTSQPFHELPVRCLQDILFYTCGLMISMEICMQFPLSERSILHHQRTNNAPGYSRQWFLRCVSPPTLCIGGTAYPRHRVLATSEQRGRVRAVVSHNQTTVFASLQFVAASVFAANVSFGKVESEKASSRNYKVTSQ